MRPVAPPNQLIVLTHEKGFLEKIVNQSQFEAAKYLRIIPDGIDANGCKQSRVDDCDPWNNYLQPLEIKYLEEIKTLVDGNVQIPLDAHDKCRIILERIIRNKYHLQLRHLGRASSIGDYILELQNQGIYDAARFAEFDEIKGKLHQPHHAQRSEAAEDSEGDVRFVLSETLRVSALI